VTSRAAKLRATLEHGSRSFSLATHLLPREHRDAVAAAYAFCRRCDDAIDRAPRAEQPAALARLRAELEALYQGAPHDDPALAAFGEVAQARRIPMNYPSELLDGLAMDVEGRRYRDLAELLGYCYRVAGTVGLMMCHVMGVRDDRALPHAVHLGVALQMTNIARDVLEDFRLGRVYLPDDHLGAEPAARLHAALGGPLPRPLAAPVAAATLRLLEAADAFYQSADEGLLWLSPRDAFAIRAARWIYWAIGARVRAVRGDPWQGRAVVPAAGKARMVARALAAELGALPARASGRERSRIPEVTLHFHDELLCVQARGRQMWGG
jgi:phytoene synthase